MARAKGDGQKEKECTTEGKSRLRRDEKAPWALNYGSGEGGGGKSRGAGPGTVEGGRCLHSGGEGERGLPLGTRGAAVYAIDKVVLLGCLPLNPPASV